MPGTELVQLRRGRAALEKARANGEVRELKRIGDLAAAAKRFAAAQGLAEDSKRFAAELELDAKRYLGEVLAKGEKHPGARPDPEHGGNPRVPPSAPPKLADLGLTKRQSADAQKLAVIPEKNYEAFKAAARSDTLTVKRALRVERERKRDPGSESVEPVSVSGGIEIRHGDLRDSFDDLTGQVDAIITDPPYPAEFIEEFDALGELAARLLKPEGLLAAMVGQTHLPAYIERLSRHLTYRWCGAYLTEGPATRIHGRKVGTKWKPILIFGGEGFITQDVFRSDADDKEHHGWGQSESGMADLVGRLTSPGMLVVDSFLGAGTTAVVCRALDRRFVGCDIDATAVARARERIVL